MNIRTLIMIPSLAMGLMACNPGDTTLSQGDTPATALAAIQGTVPGTVIEAYGDNGSYYVVDSEQNGTARHPFNLKLPAGIGFRLVMITNEGTPEQVVTPLGFRDSTGKIRTRFVLGKDDNVDLGFVPLPMSKNEAADLDLDGDGVLDSVMVLDDVGAGNPLVFADADEDGVSDWNDDDHGGYQYGQGTVDPQDHDGDGVINRYDRDYQAPPTDSDRDGLPDNVDANPRNERDHDNRGLRFDRDGDGYLDDDRDRDGYHDDDKDRDGYHDDDHDRDGYHDDDRDHDGYHDGDSAGDRSSSSSRHEEDEHATNGRHDDDDDSHDEDRRDHEDDHYGDRSHEDDDEGHVSGQVPSQPSPTPAPAPAPTPTPTPTPAPAPGEALFASNCSGCHSATSLSGRSAAMISSAISANRGGMGFLATLTTTEIQQIADYLNQ